MNLEDRIEALEAENERLRDQIEMLEQDMGLRERFPVEWSLTGKEARVVGVLLARDTVSRRGFMSALYDVGADEEPEIKIVDVFVCKVRKKLARFGITINTHWGEGYYMLPEMKAKAREQMAQSVGVAA